MKFSISLALSVFLLAPLAGLEGALAVDLSGQWQFQLDPDDVGIEEQWFDQGLGDTIELPATTAAAGKGRASTVELNLEAETLKRLVQRHPYLGAAWYRRSVVLPEGWTREGTILYLERVLWESRVWINGHPVGNETSLSTPHRYDIGTFLREGENTITVRIDNREILPIGIGHAYTEETQTIWNGILGELQLREGERVAVTSLQLTPEVASGSVVVEVSLQNMTGGDLEVGLKLAAFPDNFEGIAPAEAVLEIYLPKGISHRTLVYDMGDGFSTWSEFSTRLYRMQAIIEKDGAVLSETSTEFGMRSIRADGKHILVNGQRAFFRGNLDCAIFPQTGHPDVEGSQWEKIMRTLREWGLNHLRLHSWTPPEAAFEAADRHGIYLQIELPNWSFQNGYLPEVDNYFRREGERILKEYGNHPSLVMMSMGNELTGDYTYLDSLEAHFRDIHPSILYTSTTFSFSERGKDPGPQDDYFISQETTGGWVRGQGFLNSTVPNTDSDYAAGLATVPIPLITHEVGQYVVYPDLSDLDQYRDSPMRNVAYESIARDLAEKGRLEEAPLYTAASGKLAAILYREDMERALRTKDLSGIQLLQLQDFPGQSTATVGLLDPFWESKGILEAGDFRKFCSPTVPLLLMPQRIYHSGDTFRGVVELAHFGEAALPPGTVRWVARDHGTTVASGEWQHGVIELGNGHVLGTIEFDLADIPAPAVLDIEVSLPEVPAVNDWKLWLYPETGIAPPPANVTVAEQVTPELIASLEAGARVLLLPPRNTILQPIFGRFIPVFWSPVHFSNQPGTLGALINPEHPVYAGFPTDFHTDWQWWDLLSDSVAVDLQHLDSELSMPFRFVDKFNRNALPAGIFEARVGQGRLFVCTLDIEHDLAARPAAARLRASIMDYLASGQFDPAGRLNAEDLETLFGKPKLMTATNSQHPDFPADNAVDGDPETIWHSDWNHHHGPPFQLTVELPQSQPILGFRYVPRQEGTNGLIKVFQILVGSADGDWTEVTPRQSFPPGHSPVEILFDSPVTGKFLRIEIFTSQGGEAMASAAEFLPLLDSSAAENMDVRDLGIIPGFNDTK